MNLRVFFLLILSLAGGCSHGPDQGRGDGQFYSYVDPQGNLVTVKRSPEEGGDAERSETNANAPSDDGARSPDGESGGDDEERYQTTEEVDKELEERQRDRFISYVGPDGEVITRPLDLVAEREAEQKQPESFERLDPSTQYLETVSRVPVDCCDRFLDLAVDLEPGAEKRLRFDRPVGWIRLDQAHPAITVKPSAAARRLVLRSFVHDGQYLSPRMLVLDSSGQPVLKVDNLFTRRYPETWRRYGYFEGELRLKSDHAFVVFYLPYGRYTDDEVVKLPGAGGVVEDGTRPALTGELVVRGYRAAPVEGTNSGAGGQTSCPDGVECR